MTENYSADPQTRSPRGQTGQQSYTPQGNGFQEMQDIMTGTGTPFWAQQIESRLAILEAKLAVETRVIPLETKLAAAEQRIQELLGVARHSQVPYGGYGGNTGR